MSNAGKSAELVVLKDHKGVFSRRDAFGNERVSDITINSLDRVTLGQRGRAYGAVSVGRGDETGSLLIHQ